MFEAESTQIAVSKLHACLEHRCPKGQFQSMLKMSASFNSVFEEMSCRIVRKVWTRSCTPCDVASLVDVQWPSFLNELHCLAEQWFDLTIHCQLADNLLPKHDEERELQGMVNILTKCWHVPKERKDWMYEAIDKIRRYRMAITQQKAARSLLKVKETMNLTGNFETLTSIVDVSYDVCLWL